MVNFSSISRDKSAYVRLLSPSQAYLKCCTFRNIGNKRKLIFYETCDTKCQSGKSMRSMKSRLMQRGNISVETNHQCQNNPDINRNILQLAALIGMQCNIERATHIRCRTPYLCLPVLKIFVLSGFGTSALCFAIL